jgi:hypothetical protein
LAEQGIQPNGEALTQELWGLSGYKDGADRFFMKAPKKQGEGPPESVQLQQLKGQQDAEKTQANNDTKLQIEQMKQEIQNKDLMLKAQAQAHKEKMDQLDLKMQQMQNEFSNRFSQQTGSIDNMMKVVGALQKNKQITQPRPNGSAN